MDRVENFQIQYILEDSGIIDNRDESLDKFLCFFPLQIGGTDWWLFFKNKMLLKFCLKFKWKFCIKFWGFGEGKKT